MRFDGPGRANAARQPGTPRRTGAFVVLVGPDGVGKTTLAEMILARLDGHYFHFCPPLFERWSDTPNPGHLVRSDAPRERRLEPLPSLARLLRRFVLFWIGYLSSVRPAMSSGDLVLADRWAYGYLAAPTSLKYFGPRWVARLAVRLLPSPDLVLSLDAPAETIRGRKLELPLAEIERQRSAWRTAPGRHVVVVDATKSREEVVNDVATLLLLRQPDLRYRPRDD